MERREGKLISSQVKERHCKEYLPDLNKGWDAGEGKEMKPHRLYTGGKENL